MIAIRCFGHFWSKELVNWGSRGQGAGGRLEGYQLRDRKPFKVDFKDQIAVYALFAEDREPVYVGQTGAGEQRLLLRLRQHSQGPLRDRWTHFSWFGLREVNDSNGKLSEHQKPESRCGGTNSEALDETESVLLQLLEPRLNKQGPRWGKETQEYLQYIEQEFGDAVSANPEIQELHEKLDAIQQQIKNLGGN